MRPESSVVPSGSRQASARPAHLRLLPLAQIDLLEDYQPGREDRLGERIRADGLLRHPVIVAGAAGRVLALDGHHRLEFLRRHGCSHAPVQVARLDGPLGVRLGTWAHLGLVDSEEDLFCELESQDVAFHPAGAAAAEADVASGKALCWFALYGRSESRVYCLASEGGPSRPLQVLTAAYQPVRFTLEDLVPQGRPDPDVVFRQHGRFNLMVRFARFGADDLQTLARAGERIPAGITRVLLPAGRALGLNVPLRLLRPIVSDAERRAWLASRMAQPPRYFPGPALLAEPEPRRYAEPLLVYDQELHPEAC